MARWKKFLIGGAVGILLLGFLAGPMILSSIIRSRVIETIEKETTGRAEIDDVDFSWWGPIAIEGLVIRDPNGEVILNAPRSLVYGSLFKGFRDLRIKVENPRALVRRHEDGSLNWEKLIRKKEPTGEKPKKESDAKLAIELQNARIELASGAEKSEFVVNGLGSLEGKRARYDVNIEGLRFHGDEKNLAVEARDFPLGKLRVLYPVPALSANGDAALVLGDRITGSGRFDLGQAALSFELGEQTLVRGFAELSAFREDLRGRAEGEVRVDDARGTARVAITNFQAPGVSDPRITIEADANVAREPLDITIHEAKVSSSFLRTAAKGRVQGGRLRLEGDLWYVPQKLDKVFDLPGDFLGTREEQVTFSFESPLKGGDLVHRLRETVGTATLGVGHWTSHGVDLAGRMDSGARAGVLEAKGSLEVNRGRANLTTSVDARGAEPQIRLEGTFRDVLVHPAMADFMKFLHPLFFEGPGLAGSLEGSVDLKFATPFAKERLNGRGSVRVADIVVKDAPILRELGAVIDVGTIHMDPIVFLLENGRVSYEKPLRMKLSGQETTWTGSIGMDGTLDLAWEIPVGAKLIEKYPALSVLSGELVRIPVRGTLQSPRVEWQNAVEGLVKGAGKRELRDRAEDLLGDLFGANSESAAKKLLAEADRLYGQGRKSDAARRYAEIRSKYGSTRVYRDNRDLINERAGAP